MSSLLKSFRRSKQHERPATPQTPEPALAGTSPPRRTERPAAAAPRPQTDGYLDVTRDANPLLVDAKKQYNEAIRAFDQVFELYASKNTNVVKLNANSIAEGARRALSCTDTSQSAKVFGETVQWILQTTTKADEMQPSFNKHVCSVLSTLFPLIKLALGLTESVADV